MARSTLVPIPDDITIADLDRAFARARSVRKSGLTPSVHRAKRSKPGGPYRVTFIRGGTYGELGRVLLTPTADGRSLNVRSRDTAGRITDGMLYGVAALFLVVGLAMAPLDNWHLKDPLISLAIGVVLIALARLMTWATRLGEGNEAAETAALAFDIARQARGSGVAVDGGDDQEAAI